MATFIVTGIGYAFGRIWSPGDTIESEESAFSASWAHVDPDSLPAPVAVDDADPAKPDAVDPSAAPTRRTTKLKP